ncbi:CLUMA_CG006632, isoform A [Clunio marinus]|uniref:CLUMA_CG006632, isoform A n=1 Tax=Clunio marinus TaxID=568069 RepID=A0A1J1I069_9DIPT|nr:CLUMA_CG006632, isoform A [Clunio marinus]
MIKSKSLIRCLKGSTKMIRETLQYLTFQENSNRSEAFSADPLHFKSFAVGSEKWQNKQNPYESTSFQQSVNPNYTFFNKNASVKMERSLIIIKWKLCRFKH